MREQKNKSQKGIIVFLAFIAVCMVCIIVLLASNIITSQKPQNNAKNEDSAQSETLIGDNENAEEETIDDLRDAGIDVEASTEGREIKSLPGYKDTAEWADEPITPTKVENLDIFDEMLEDDEDTIFYMKQIVEQTVLQYAESFECYAEPTIITDYIGYGSCRDGFFVDFHTMDKTIVCFSATPSDDMTIRPNSVLMNETNSQSRPINGENFVLINPKMCFDTYMSKNNINPYQYDIIDIKSDAIQDDEWKNTAKTAETIQKGFSNYCITNLLADIQYWNASIPKDLSCLQYAYLDDFGYSEIGGKQIAYAHLIFTGGTEENIYTLRGGVLFEISEDGALHVLSQKELKNVDKNMESPVNFEFLIKKR